MVFVNQSIFKSVVHCMMKSLTHHLIYVVTIVTRYITFNITYCILSTWYLVEKQHVYLIIDLPNDQYSYIID